MPDIRSALIYGLGAALLAAVLWGFAERTRGASARSELAAVRLAAAQAHAAAEAREREQEREWSNRTTEIANAAQTKINALEGDLSAARSAADRLRIAARAAAARGASEAAKAAEPSASQPDHDPIGVLADVLVELDRRAGIYAEAADRLRTAGEACERASDAVSD